MSRVIDLTEQVRVIDFTEQGGQPGRDCFNGLHGEAFEESASVNGPWRRCRKLRGQPGVYLVSKRYLRAMVPPPVASMPK
jgi:hypothetical protein